MHKFLMALPLALMVLGVPAFAQEPVADTTVPTAGVGGPADESDAAELDLFARDTLRIDTIICPFKGDIEYQPGDIECGLLQVPENRENPESRFIELHFVKLNSSWGDEDRQPDEDAEPIPGDIELAPGRRDDPIIYLTGGPGAQASYYVGRLKDHTVLRHRDVYILEQRGIGSSGDFCGFYGTRNPQDRQADSFDDYAMQSGMDMADCARNAAASGVDLSGYNTIENARDIRALRMALGYPQWNVWGISYGSILGQAYIREDPEGILAVALDAIVPLDVRSDPMHWRAVNWYDRDLKKLDELCQADPDCAAHYPNLGQRVRDAVSTVIERPIVVDAKDVELYPDGKALVFPDIVAFLPFLLFYEQSNYPGLPGIIYAWADAVERRDDAVFKTLTQAGGNILSSSQGMANAILCIDGDFDAQAIAGARDKQEHPILAQLGTVESLRRDAELCRELGMTPRPPSDYAPVETDIPSLIIEGDMDPITPPPLAHAILPGFRNGTYVEFPYAGHGPSRSVKCAGSMLNAFFDDPTAEPDLRCTQSMKAPEFVAPLYISTIAPRMAALATEDKKALVGPIAWFGVSLLIILIAFLVLTFAPVLRFIDNRRADRSAGARLAAWLAATTAVAGIGIFAAAGGVTYKTVEVLPAFGLVPWAVWGAWAGLAGGLLGLIAVVVAIRARRAALLRMSSVLGFVLTGAAAVSLSAFMLVWDLRPF